MDAALVFEDAVDAFAGYGHDNFFETAGGAFGEGGDGELPAAAFAVALVHLEEVAGKDCSFVAARSGANLEDGVAGVFGVGGDELELYLLFEPGHLGERLFELEACHLAHVGVRLGLEERACFGGIVGELSVAASECDELLQVLVLAGEVDVSLHIGDDGGVCYECRHFLEAAFDAVQVVED